MKRLVSILLSVILACGMAVPVSAAGATFSDVPTSHWAYTQIERAAEAGVMNGTGDGKFSPENTLTLAQFVVIMTRAFYDAEVEASTAEGTWYAKHFDVARVHGLLSGVNSYRPNDGATRYQMAAVMANLMADKGAQMPSNADLEAVQGKIGDWADIPAQCREAAATVFHLGLITGTDSKGTFNGAGTMKRSHATVV